MRAARLSIRQQLAALLALTAACTFALVTVAGAYTAPDPFEPDDTADLASHIATNTPAERSAPAGDTDWVKFDAVRGRSYEIRWYLPYEYGTRPTIGVTLYDESMRELAVGAQNFIMSPTWPGYLRFLPTADGTYYVKFTISDYTTAYYIADVIETEPSTIEGRLVEAGTGAPVEGARVRVYPQGEIWWTVNYTVAGEARTAADGTFIVPVAGMGKHTLYYDDPDGGRFGEWYGGYRVLPGSYYGPWIQVGRSTHATGLAGTLYRPSLVRGITRDYKSGQVVAGLRVTPSPGDPYASQPYVVTGADGTFSVNGDPRVALGLGVSDPAAVYAPTSYSVSAASLASSPVDIEIPVGVGAVLEGTVWDGTLGGTIANMPVKLYRGGGSRTLYTTTVTDADGHYRFAALPADSTWAPAWGATNSPYGQQWNGPEYGWNDPVVLALGDVRSIDTTFFDTRVPATTIGPFRPAWQRGPVHVSLSATDDGWAGVGATYYRFNGGTVETYSADFDYSVEGTSVLEYWSADSWSVAGTRNTEPTKTAILRIDDTPPVVAAMPEGDNVTVAAGSSVMLSASDGLSGVSRVRWRIDGFPGEGSKVDIVGGGAHHLVYWAEDLAGNQSPYVRVTLFARQRVNAVLTASTTAPKCDQPISLRVDVLAAGEPVHGVPFTLQSSSDGGGTWETVEDSVTVDGSAVFARVVERATRFRVVSAPTDEYDSAESAPVNILPYALVGTPTAPASVRRAAGFSVSGLLNPRHTAGTRPIVIYAEKYERGAWRYKFTRSALAADTATASSYTVRMSLPTAGTWRLRARHADSDHRLSWSGYRKVVVR